MSNSSPPHRETKKFSFRIGKLFQLNTEGYSSEENQELLATAFGWKALFIMLVLLACLTFCGFFAKEALADWLVG